MEPRETEGKGDVVAEKTVLDEENIPLKNEEALDDLELGGNNREQEGSSKRLVFVNKDGNYIYNDVPNSLCLIMGTIVLICSLLIWFVILGNLIGSFFTRMSPNDLAGRISLAVLLCPLYVIFPIYAVILYFYYVARTSVEFVDLKKMVVITRKSFLVPFVTLRRTEVLYSAILSARTSLTPMRLLAVCEEVPCKNCYRKICPCKKKDSPTNEEQKDFEFLSEKKIDKTDAHGYLNCISRAVLKMRFDYCVFIKNVDGRKVLVSLPNPMKRQIQLAKELDEICSAKIIGDNRT